jgi:DNA-binding NtrC family response regulator
LPEQSTKTVADILLLTRHFIEKMYKFHDKNVLAVTDEVKNKL